MPSLVIFIESVTQLNNFPMDHLSLHLFCEKIGEVAIAAGIFCANCLHMHPGRRDHDGTLKTFEIGEALRERK